MKELLYLISLLLLQIHSVSRAQEKPFTLLNEESGLAYNAVYCASRDLFGKLWIGTGNGLSIYDGNNFANIRKSDGLPGNAIWAIEPIDDDLVYVASYLGGLTVFRKNQIWKTLHLKHPVKDDTFRKLHYSTIHKTLFIGTDFGIYILKDTTFHLLGHFNEPAKKSSVLAIAELQGTIYFTIHNDRETGGFFRLDINSDDILKSKVVQILGDGQGYGLTKLGNQLFVAIENVIYRYYPETGDIEKCIETDSQFYSWTMTGTKDGEILVGGFGEGPFKTGIFSIEPDKKEIKSTPFNTGNVSVMNLISDPELNLTYACTDHGLFLLPESPVEIFPLKGESLITDILSIENTVYILTEKNIYRHIDGKTEKFISISDVERIINIKAREYLKNSTINRGKNNVDRLLNQLAQSQSMVPLRFTSEKGGQFLQTSSGAISFPDFATYLPIPHGVFTYRGAADTTFWVPRYDLLKFFPSISTSLDNPYLHTQDSILVKDIVAIKTKDDITYFASNINGLFALKGNRIHHLNSSNSKMDDVLFDMDMDTVGGVWCASSEGNLFRVVFSEQLKIQNIYNKTNTPIKGVNYKWLKFSKKYLYIGTDAGLNQIPLDQIESDSIREGNFYNRYNGYEFISAKSPQIGHDGSLFVFTSDKLIRIKPTKPAKTKLRIVFSDIKLNNALVNIEDLVDKRLPSKIRSITLQFATAKIPVSGNIEYSYSINDNSREVGNSVLLSNPRPGQYTLICEALDKETSITYKEVINFSVRKPLWQSPFALALFIAGFWGIIYLLIRQNFNRKRKIEEEKLLLSQKISDLQIQSLQSQINPHFVFNSLNSIQNFILNNNPEEASVYLATIGGIIRKNLEMISEEVISLSRELEFLNKYIEIEKLRFKDNLDIEIINQVSEVEKTYIPPMLIHPLVENSIKHGIRILNKTGIIKVFFELNNGLLTICVEDNGIGRAVSAQYKDQNHNSFGLKLIDERLSLMNDRYKSDDFGISIIDLYEEGEPSGTRVKIMIPQVF